MDYQQAMRKGILAAKAGNSILARLHLQEAVELTPDSVDCWLWLAWVAESPESARLSLERVLELDPQHEAAQAGLNWARGLIDFQIHESTDDAEQHVPDHPESSCEAALDSVESVKSAELTITDDEPTTESECSAESDVDVPADDLETSDPVGVEEEAFVKDSEPAEADPHAGSASLDTAETEGDSASRDLEAESCFNTGALADEESIGSTAPTVCGDFTNEYFVQEAVVASVDEQLESLFASGQLLDQLESVDTIESETLEEETEVAATESDLATEPEFEFESVDAATEPGRETESAPDAIPDPLSADASDDTPEQCALEDSEAERATVEEQASYEEDISPTNADEDAVTCVAEEPSLPDESQDQTSDVSASETASDDDGRPTIVICDDSPTVRKLVCMSLEPHGFRVLTAADGAEGTALIQRVLPNLVLTDINMPEMDGYQLCKNVTKNPLTQSIPVVMLSGKDGLFDKLRGKLVGSTDHMSKPFSPRDLLRVVRSHLESCSAWSS
jgi:twitching motility two-component system response regulator PilG